MVFLISGLLHAGVLLVPYLGVSSEPVYPLRSQNARNIPQFNMVLQQKSDDVVDPPVVVERIEPSVAVPPSTPIKESAEPRRVGEELLPVKGVAYFTSKELSQPAKPIDEIALDSPELGELPQTGTAILKLWIDATGVVTDVQIVSRDAPEAFVKFTTQVFKRTRFVPGQRDGVPVGSIMKIEVRYEEPSKSPPQGSAKP